VSSEACGLHQLEFCCDSHIREAVILVVMYVASSWLLVLWCGQAAWLLRVTSCIDLTTLAGDDTLANVQRLCFKAKQPIRQDLMAAMGLKDLGQHFT